MADNEGVEPAELDLIISEWIDLDAVEQLADSTDSWTLTFELPDRTVTVQNDGPILVDERPGRDR